MQELREIMQVLGTYSIDVGQKFAEMGRNPALLLSAEWRTEVALSMTVMVVAAGNITELEAPESLSELDEIAKTMAVQLQEGLRLYTAAVDETDPDKLEQGNELILQATPLVYEIDDIIIGLCGE